MGDNIKTNKENIPDSLKTITIPLAEYNSYISRIAELEQQSRWLAEQLKLFRRKQFGSSSEKASNETFEQMNFLFDEAETYEYIEKKTEENAEASDEIKVKAHTRKHNSGSVKDIIPENIKVEEVIHELNDEEIICSECGEKMSVIGREVHESLKIIPAEAILKRDIYLTYACKKCENIENSATDIIKTPKEPVIIPGGFASPETVAYISTQKFVMGSPLFRQEHEWNEKGIMLSRQTMSNWMLKCSENWLAPIYDVLHSRLLSHDIIHADETELQVLHEPGKRPQSKSYMWLYRTGKDAEHPIVLYDYQPDRSGENARNFLNGFGGFLQTDGYAGYNAVENVTRIGCLAHIRRKFDETIKSMPRGCRSETAEQGEAYCTKLFELEKEYADLTPEERKEQRIRRTKPVLDAMLAWANTKNASPKSHLGAALTYLKNQWGNLTNILLDGRTEISNNIAERSIKPFVISRKNFLFANTPLGAKSSAIIFSLIQTARENGLDAYKYLVFVLENAPKLSITKPDNWAELLTPEHAPESCVSKNTAPSD